MKAPKDERVYTLLGYAIQCNEYIHMQQIIYLENVLKKSEKGLKIINNIILQREDKDILSLEAAVDLLNQEEESYRKEFMAVLVKVLCLDGELDEREKQYIVNVQKDYILDENIIKKTLKNFKCKVYGNVIKRFLRKIWEYLRKKENFFEFDRKCYTDSKNVMGDIYKIIAKKELVQKVGYGKAGNSYLQNEAKKELENLYRTAKEYFEEANSKIEGLLGRDLTVALVGRTKAGKSSLFSLLSGGYGQQFIGMGAQRTTKISAVTHMNSIKFIDTPGLNAADNEGRSDEQHTLEVIKKSDFVSFIFVTDSLALDTKEIIEYIAKNNMPLFAIVNLKNADIFRYESELKHFLEENYNWIEDNGVDRIDGWKDNLKRYATEKHFEHILEFGEIFIYAARVAKQNLSNLPIEIKKELTLKNKVKILKKSNYKEVINRMTQKIKRNALMYRWS